MNKISTETRIAVLENQVMYLHSFYMLLINLIFRYDDRLRLTAIDVIRKILQNPIPTHPLDQATKELLQSLRDELLAPPRPEIVEVMSQPPVRPVK